MPGTYRSPAETGLYYLKTRYYDPEVGRFISADDPDILEVQDDLYDKNLYTYCDNNPVNRIDEVGDMWELALAGGGTLATGSGFSLGAMGGSVMTALGAITPAGWAVIGTIAVVTVAVVTYSKVKALSKPKCNKMSKGGKQRIYDSGLIGVTLEDLKERLKNPELTGEEKRRLQKQQKAKDARNQQKRQNNKRNSGKKKKK